MRGTWQSAATAADTGVRAACAAHADELYRFALRLLPEQALAEEAVKEVFLRAWRATRASGRRRSAHPAAERGWLLATAAAVVVEIAWARSIQLPDWLRTGEDPVRQLQLSWQVEEALRQISADHRRALVETCYRGRSCGEVAADLGIPEETLRSRVYYGLRALRLALEEKGWTECAAN